MFKQSSRRRHCLSVLLIVSVFLTGLLPLSSVAQDRRRKPIIVSFGQPNIWSLEQAHYLLARMHMTNLALQAKALSDEDLNPNATHGTRIEILKQLLEVGASFDQGIGFQNQRIVEQARFNDDRRRTLTTNRDRLRNDSLDLEMQINELTRERKSITDPTSERAKQLDAQIEEKQKNQAKIDKEITFHDNEIGKLGAEPSGTPSAPSVSPSPFDKNRLPSSMLDKLTDQEFQKLLDPGRDPKLNATTMLDNTVQLQYEIIAKQLTLLRDEVGPGERLVFLELPQSIYTTPDSGDEKMAQTWWHVNGYTRTDPLVRLLLELYEVEWKWKKIQAVPAFDKISSLVNGVECTPAGRNSLAKKFDDEQNAHFAAMYHDFKCEHDTARYRVLRNIFRAVSTDFDRVEQGGARDTDKLIEAIRKVIGTTPKPAEKIDQSKFTRLPLQVKAGLKSRKEVIDFRDKLLTILSNTQPAVESGPTGEPLYTFDQGIEFIPLDADAAASPNPLPDIDRGTVRTVDIIPRQSSLNVNDVNETVKATGILAAFKFLFGFAGQVNFQRQREQFEQFVHQELYASGFGKGNRSFGWTFGALPGTKRVAPGVRTTYAALVVPTDAESLILSARGCYFPRKSYQPLDYDDTSHDDWSERSKFRSYNCGDQETYILPVPGGGNTSNFWVTSVNYESVKRGEYVTVSVRGNNFSSQMGVLVNGVPLFSTVGLAQPQLMPKKPVAAGAQATADPSECSNTSIICGRYERVDPQQIVFSFKMPPNSEIGIPTITLVAPGKSLDLNSLTNVTVNNIPLAQLSERSDGVPFMFGVRPSAVLSITDLQLLDAASPAGWVHGLLIGTGFDKAKDTVYVNGAELKAPPTAGPAKTFKSANLYEVYFRVSGEDTIKVTVVQDTAVVSKSIPNPSVLKITNTTPLSFKPGAQGQPGVMIVKVDGAGFTPNIRVRDVTGARQWRLQFVSSTQLILRLIDPEAPIVINLEDSVTHATISTLIQTLPVPQ
jgi:hypothetical protein